MTKADSSAPTLPLHHLQAALTGAVVCLLAAVAYCAYSVLFPELQRRKIDAARKKRLRSVTGKSLFTPRHLEAPLLPMGKCGWLVTKETAHPQSDWLIAANIPEADCTPTTVAHGWLQWPAACAQACRKSVCCSGASSLTPCSNHLIANSLCRLLLSLKAVHGQGGHVGSVAPLVSLQTLTTPAVMRSRTLPSPAWCTLCPQLLE